jgi:hypothetical protein
MVQAVLPQRGTGARKVYATPRLTVYGDVREVTRGGAGSKVDVCSTAAHNRGKGGCP